MELPGFFAGLEEGLPRRGPEKNPGNSKWRVEISTRRSDCSSVIARRGAALCPTRSAITLLQSLRRGVISYEKLHDEKLINLVVLLQEVLLLYMVNFEIIWNLSIFYTYLVPSKYNSNFLYYRSNFFITEVIQENSRWEGIHSHFAHVCFFFPFLWNRFFQFSDWTTKNKKIDQPVWLKNLKFWNSAVGHNLFYFFFSFIIKKGDTDWL